MIKIVGSENLQQKKILQRRHYNTLLNWIKKEAMHLHPLHKLDISRQKNFSANDHGNSAK